MTCNIWDKYQENNNLEDRNSYPPQIQQHLTECEVCRQKELIDNKLRVFVESRQEFKADQFFTERLMAKVTESPNINRNQNSQTRLFIRSAAAVAILVTSISLGILAGSFSAGFYQQKSSNTYSELAQALQFGSDELSFDLVVINEE